MKKKAHFPISWGMGFGVTSAISFGREILVSTAEWDT